MAAGLDPGCAVYLRRWERDRQAADDLADLRLPLHSPVIGELNHRVLLLYHNLSYRQFILGPSDFRVLLLMLFTAGTRFCFSTETSPWALPLVKFTRNK